LAIVFRRAPEAEGRWRKLNAHRFIPKATEGVVFEEAIETLAA